MSISVPAGVIPLKLPAVFFRYQVISETPQKGSFFFSTGNKIYKHVVNYFMNFTLLGPHYSLEAQAMLCCMGGGE